MSLKLEIFLLLGCVLPLAVTGSDLLGIFQEQSCLFSLMRIEEVRGDDYRQEAADRGYTDPFHVQEYVERRKRNRYLYSETDRYEQEYAMAEEVFLGLTKLPFAEGQKQRRAIMAEAAEWWTVGEHKMAEEAPLFFTVARDRLPSTREEADTLTALFELQYVLARRRSDISRLLTVAPVTSTVTDLPLSSRAKAKQFADVEMLKFITTELPHGATMQAIRVEVLRETLKAMKQISEQEVQAQEAALQARTAAIAATLLASPRLPREFKVEINKQLDFDTKCGSFANPVFHAYLKRLAGLYQVDLPSSKEK